VSAVGIKKISMLVEKKDGTLDMLYRANKEEAHTQEELNQTDMDSHAARADTVAGDGILNMQSKCNQASMQRLELVASSSSASRYLLSRRTGCWLTIRKQQTREGYIEAGYGTSKKDGTPDMRCEVD
jgi:hypothetical protein